MTETKGASGMEQKNLVIRDARMLPHYADAVKACKRSPSGKLGSAIARGEEGQCTVAGRVQRRGSKVQDILSGCLCGS